MLSSAVAPQGYVKKMKKYQIIYYDKIVRDKVPEIVVAKGGSCKTKIVNGHEAISYLIKKLHEEADELADTRDAEGEAIGELADILECVYAIANKMSVPMERIEFVRVNKVSDRGKFNRNIILLEAILDNQR
jgi:predicted house-cleaning noncanonical NTP pyrophosphatase (MazG superfamily)